MEGAQGPEDDSQRGQWSEWPQNSNKRLPPGPHRCPISQRLEHRRKPLRIFAFFPCASGQGGLQRDAAGDQEFLGWGCSENRGERRDQPGAGPLPSLFPENSLCASPVLSTTYWNHLTPTPGLGGQCNDSPHFTAEIMGTERLTSLPKTT